VHAVLNWLWQGASVAAALFVMLRLLEHARANVRYTVCGLTLLIVLAIPVLPSLLPMGDMSQAAARAIAPVVSIPASPWTSAVAMLGLWSLWVGAQIIQLSGALIRVRQARQTCRPFPNDVERRLRHWMSVGRGRRRARLVLSEAIGSAAVLGWGTPTIAIAPALVDRLSSDELDSVVIHEWAHVRRCDDLANLLQLVSRVVAGWHPAVWWIDRRLRVEREVACDEIAVAVTGSAKSYAVCLLKLAELAAATRVPVAALGMLTTSSLHHRVARIVSSRALAPAVRSRGVASAGIVVLLGLSTALAGFELFAAIASPPPSRALMIPTGIQPPSRLVTITLPAPQPEAARTRGTAGLTRNSSVPSRPLVQPTTSNTTATGALIESLRIAQPSEPNLPSIQVENRDPVAVDNRQVPDETGPSAVATPLVGDPHPELRSPWATAGDAGVAIGRSSTTAGVATAGFFSRFARRIAGSF
jgi:beta-lactamase regulating signal transducer with metallopeptidase domain